MKKLCAILGSLILLFVAPDTSRSQETVGHWMLGLHGGTNFWISDFNQLKFAPAANLAARYGLGKYFSLGLNAGYGAAKTYQEPFLANLDYGYRLGYVKLNAFDASVRAFVHLAPGANINPYMYVGAGGYYFQRKGAGGKNLPDNNYRGSFLVPLGLGFDAFIDKTTSVSVDVGFQAFGDWTDFRRNKSSDGLLTSRVGINFFLGGGESDSDEDGLTDADERRYGTDPDKADTDVDGLKDGEEVNRYRTNPLRSDTDGDNLSDGDEVFTYKTSPTKTDTDGDLLSDGDEVLLYHTDPNKMDTDGDGLTDGDEVLADKTDPLKVDTDGDGLTDGDEVQQYKTDPHLADTDKDFLSDNEEVRVLRTDPRKADTDGGGELDGAEVKRGTDPLRPEDDGGSGTIRLEKGFSVVLPGVKFQSGSATLSRSSEVILQKALAALLEKPELRVEIAGHTDSEGSPAANDKLSKARAQAVRAWLVGRGIPPSRLTAVGYGSRSPIATNLTAEGRAKNRRIEFHVK